jgi:hypothetical protein
MYALIEKCINDTIVRADCKYLGLHWGWDKGNLGLGGYG